MTDGFGVLAGECMLTRYPDLNWPLDLTFSPEGYGAGTPVPAKAGYGIFISDLLMHSLPPDRSKKQYRPAWTATRAATGVQPHIEANRIVVMCLGENRSGFWQPHPVPSA